MPGLSLDAPRYRPNFLAMEVRRITGEIEHKEE
jgi:hypothetical protein